MKKDIHFVFSLAVAVALLIHCGPGDGEIPIDAGEMISDSGSVPDAMAMATEMPLACDTEATQTTTFSDGTVWTDTSYYATAPMDSSTQPEFWVEVCQPPRSNCSTGATCMGTSNPAYTEGGCYLSYSSGGFYDGKLWIGCGHERTRTEPGQPTEVLSPYTPPRSVRLWVR